MRESRRLAGGVVVHDGAVARGCAQAATASPLSGGFRQNRENDPVRPIPP
jgi:hypothetical protein